jgi:hypothetical protein
LGDPGRAAAIVTATYVEVWWLAGCQTDPDADVVRWIREIAERRAVEGARMRNDRPGPRSRNAAAPRRSSG